MTIRPDATSGHGHVPLFGRADEMRTLRAAVEDAINSRGRTIAIVGEPGVGKTALLDALAAQITELGGSVLHGREAELGKRRPLLPWFDALSPSCPNLDWNADETAASDAARYNLFQRISEALRELTSDRIVAVLLDDLQWADDATLELLLFCARRFEHDRLLIVWAARTEGFEQDGLLLQVGDRLRRRPSFTRIDLPGLGADEIAELIEHRTGTSVSEDIARQAQSLSGGNPLLVLEIARELTREGSLDPDIAWGQNLGLQEIIRNRLSEMAPAHRDVLGKSVV